MIKKTDTYFVISNYNTDPEIYLKYCKDYHIYDQSTDNIISENLKAKYSKISFVENTGHSISNYFRFFIENYESLPHFMMLAKGNMIGRHFSQEFFERVYLNKYYTMLYDDRSNPDKRMVSYQLYDGAFLEINNAWYSQAKVHKYFETYNDLLGFMFKNPIVPNWLLFSPGACFIVSKEQVTKYPKVFYENLKYLISYTYFPSEAYHVERMLHVIFCGTYQLNDCMLNSEMFFREIDLLSSRHSNTNKSIKREFRFLKQRYLSLIDRIAEKLKF